MAGEEGFKLCYERILEGTRREREREREMESQILRAGTSDGLLCTDWQVALWIQSGLFQVNSNAQRHHFPQYICEFTIYL